MLQPINTVRIHGRRYRVILLQSILIFYDRTSCFKNLMKIMGNPVVKKAQF